MLKGKTAVVTGASRGIGTVSVSFVAVNPERTTDQTPVRVAADSRR